MGALYLKPLDDRLEKAGYHYTRFMDDWVILTATRWKLRQAVKLVTQTLAELKLEKHPDKTYIGKIEKGFDFLGYRFEPRGLRLALETLKRFKERVTQLYEQGADTHRIGQYVRRFNEWAAGKIPDPFHILYLYSYPLPTSRDRWRRGLPCGADSR